MRIVNGFMAMMNMMLLDPQQSAFCCEVLLLLVFLAIADELE